MNRPRNPDRPASLPPGSLVHKGEQFTDTVRVERIAYNADTFTEGTLDRAALDQLGPEDTHHQWIDVTGLHDVALTAQVGNQFGVGPLVMEDILDTFHRPKAEWLDGFLFVTLRMIGRHPEHPKLVTEQVSFCLGEGWLISFQEREGDVFDGVRKRLRENVGPLRKVGTDRLFNRLVDVVVDHYYLAIEFLNSELERLETAVMDDPTPELLAEVRDFQKEIRRFRRSVFPLREAMALILREDSSLVNPETTRYMHDVYDHIIQICDQIDNQRETASSLQELYLTSIGQRNNQVMQVLTIIATIFIPLTFIAGIYGMNFDDMPELHWEYGYQTVWALMLVVTVVMVIYFKRKRWF